MYGIKFYVKLYLYELLRTMNEGWSPKSSIVLELGSMQYFYIGIL